VAIKGKGRSRNKQVARAPKRAPVPVPVPFVQRRWVQRTTFFILGVLVVSGFVWLMNGLRSKDAESQAADHAAAKRTAAQAYKSAVEEAIAPVAVINPGVAPAAFNEMGATLQQMGQGKTPDDAVDVFTNAAKDAKAAAAAITKYDVGTKVDDQGFQAIETVAFTDSSQQIVQAVELYQRAAEVGEAAAEATGPQAEQLTGIAQGLFDSAQTTLAKAWSSYLSALSAGGILEQPAGGGVIPELPGGGA
jgi:hypothetical protein